VDRAGEESRTCHGGGGSVEDEEAHPSKEEGEVSLLHLLLLGGKLG
jgi:hypothetical protein